MVKIIAELSGNHLGSIENAKNLIVAAHNAGADFVKLQTYKPETITLDINKSDFRVANGHPLWSGRSLYSLYEEAHTPWEWHEELFSFAHNLNIGIFSSPFDSTAVDLLESLDVPMYKIASLETGDIPLIECIAKTNKPIIASTGASSLADIDLMIQTIRKYNSNDLTLLLCTSNYPSQISDAHLKRLELLRERYNVDVGLSDHTIGEITSISAVALGAKVVEKHLCLGRDLGVPDAGFSLEPSEFTNLVRAIRETEMALGEHTWIELPSESESRRMRRSLYIYKNVTKGETISELNIKSVRPSFGLQPKYWEKVIGKKFNKNFEAGTPLSFDQIESIN